MIEWHAWCLLLCALYISVSRKRHTKYLFANLISCLSLLCVFRSHITSRHNIVCYATIEYHILLHWHLKKYNMFVLMQDLCACKKMKQSRTIKIIIYRTMFIVCSINQQGEWHRTQFGSILKYSDTHWLCMHSYFRLQCTQNREKEIAYFIIYSEDVSNYNFIRNLHCSVTVTKNSIRIRSPVVLQTHILAYLTNSGAEYIYIQKHCLPGDNGMINLLRQSILCCHCHCCSCCCCPRDVSFVECNV